MSEPPGSLADALAALRLFAAAPERFGGICLRGGGPVRDMLVEHLRAAIGGERPWRRLPPHIDNARLLGSVDIAASLAAGRTIHERGLLDEAASGILIAPMAERMREDVAGKLAQVMDTGSCGFGLVLLDDGIETDERPPAALLERMAFHVDLSQVERLDIPALPDWPPSPSLPQPGQESLAALAATAAALGIGSVRALLFASRAASTGAALAGHKTIESADLALAARLVFAPRASQVPQAQEDAPPPEPPENAPDDTGEDDRSGETEPPEQDLVLEAALAAIPPDLLAHLASARRMLSASGSGSGRQTASKLRGRPLSARPGIPRAGARLALIDSLRAAVPWQAIRRVDRGGDVRDGLLMRKDDLRVRRFSDRAGVVTVFCVDASGSAAMARLAEAKGAVELLLAQAYVKRSEVALVAFRGLEAELLLPPTRSLTRARRELAGLPGGGGTPLASGLSLSFQLAQQIHSRGRTPFLVVLTDGSANIAADGSASRSAAREDAKAAARRIAAAGIDALVIDIAPRPRPDAERLAEAMHARYLPLPMADARALERVVSEAQAKATA